MLIADILRSKGRDVVSVAPSATVVELLAALQWHNIGAVVVVNEEAVVGIVSERDVVRQLHRLGPTVLQRPVREIMTSTVFSCSPADTVDSLANTMSDRHIRHMPVIEAGRLIGMVSIGDVVKNHIEQLEVDRQSLAAYIQQG